MIIRSILAAIDGSVRSAAVLELASEMAGRFSATLKVVRVVQLPPEFPAAAAGAPPDALPAHLTHEAIAEVRSIASNTPGAAPFDEPIVRFGQPWREILLLAHEMDVDLIIVGSHGYYGWDRILGTTAGKVANLADRNVLVVHERGRAPSLAKPGGSSPATGKP